MVFIHLATGFEEVEALTAADLLRRAGVETALVSVTGEKTVEGAHGFRIEADMLFEDADYSDCELIVLPGGMPGTKNLAAHRGLCDKIKEFNENGRLIAAICAAPMVFGSLGLLEGKRATCYPGCEETMIGADYTKELVTIDGNIITGEGPAAAFPYAYTILEILAGKDVADQLREGMMFNHLTRK